MINERKVLFSHVNVATQALKGLQGAPPGNWGLMGRETESQRAKLLLLSENVIRALWVSLCGVRVVCNIYITKTTQKALSLSLWSLKGT